MPKRVFGVPKSVVGMPKRVFAMPKSVVGVPKRVFAMPKRVFVVSARAVGVPTGMWSLGKPRLVLWVAQRSDRMDSCEPERSRKGSAPCKA